MSEQSTLFYRLIMDSPHIGTLIGKEVYAAQAGYLRRSDVVQLYLQIQQEKMIDVKFQAQGSSATLASAAWLASSLIGKSVDDAAHLNSQTIIHALSLKQKDNNSALLASTALSNALEKYKGKHHGI